MGDIPHEKQFHFRDGTSAKSLDELKGKIESISYDEFYGHVSDGKNDFANWIEHVLANKELATRLRSVGSIVETVELLNEELYPEEPQHDAHTESDDLQGRIEEQLFADHDETSQGGRGEKDDRSDRPALLFEPEVEEVDQPSVETDVTERFMDEPERREGQRVTTDEPPHVPITERLDLHPIHREEHMKFMVMQFLGGMLLGFIFGFILAKVIGI